MFIKKDTRKIPAIIADDADSRDTMLLARRGAEFKANPAVLLHPKNVSRFTNLRILSLYANGLTNLNGIEALSNSPIEELNVGNNLLTDLPVELNTLSATLERLWIDDNRLTILPSCVLELNLLKVLRVSNNKIEFVPNEFNKLPQLHTLALDNNMLTQIPSTVFHLEHLEKLLLRGNRLISLPSEISNLQKLSFLQISSNQIETIPEELGELTQLVTCMLNSNLITTVPLSLSKLMKLKKISFANNRITELDTMLEDTWELNGAPMEDGEEPKVEVNLFGNPLKSLGVEIINEDGSTSMVVEEEDASNKRQRVP